MTFQKATKKQQDTLLDKSAKLAQKWLVKGFTAQQCATGVWDRIGHTTSAKNEKVQIYGFYNGEKKHMRLLREVSQTEIVSFQ